VISLIKMCPYETCNRLGVGKYFSDIFTINNNLKQGDALSSLLFNIAVECAIRRVQVNRDGLKLNGTCQFWFMPLVLIYWMEAYETKER